MKAVILAGGYGTRISEETVSKPKPMIEIGGKPILWHLMKSYSSYGINDFIICCGYKGYVIKEYFSNYFHHNSDLTFRLNKNVSEIHKYPKENWNVTLIDTGESTMTGGRLKRIQNYLDENEDFCFTYGDGLSNVNIQELITFHKNHGKMATLTATYPPARFGALEINGTSVRSFQEKPKGDGILVNGGFFVLNPKIFQFLDGDETIWEEGPLKKLAKQGDLEAYRHFDFWQPMDTLKDKRFLESLWNNNIAPWKSW